MSNITINPNVLYGIYETTRDNDANDLVIGLAMYRDEHPEVEISHEEDKAIREFIGRHGQRLAKAFPDRRRFARACAVSVLEDLDREVDEEQQEAAE